MIRHGLVRVLGAGDLRDPDLANVPITVTEVRVSPDLRRATAYVVPLGGQGETDVTAALNRAAPFLRRQLAGELTLRYHPELEFEADRTFDNAARIETLLRESGENGSNGGDDGA